MLRLIFITVALLFSYSSLSANTLQNQLVECSAIKNSKKRLQCFDQLSSKFSAASDDQNLQAQSSKESEKLPDSLGGADFSKGNEPKSYIGKVTSCKASNDRRWFYFFENGQVWKQVDRRRIRHKTCEFEATIKKDGLGYVMYYGEGRKVRIKRKR